MTGRDEIAHRLAALACTAGGLIMNARGAPPQFKADGSPVTQADLAADGFIRDALARLFPDIPVVTEEATETHAALAGERFLLVDPLDGTTEFIAGRDEFTVNIALIARGAPVAGAVYAPAYRRLYLAGETARRADVAPDAALPDLSAMRPIRARPVPKTDWCAVTSRSHLDAETQLWLDANPIGQRHAAGSSLKFCAIAEGAADVYPRLSPTMEWDIAAGDAILRAAGGAVETCDGEPLRYGKVDAGFRNPSLVAWGRRT